MVTISGHQDVHINDEKCLLKALAHQPLRVAIDASAREFQFYSGVSTLLNPWSRKWIVFSMFELLYFGIWRMSLMGGVGSIWTMVLLQLGMDQARVQIISLWKIIGDQDGERKFTSGWRGTLENPRVSINKMASFPTKTEWWYHFILFAFDYYLHNNMNVVMKLLFYWI